MGADSGLLPHPGARRGLRSEARGAPWFTNLEEMAASDLLDAVYIASPNAFHYEQARLFLEHGKHVICEKPLCAQARKVRELQQIAKDRGLVYLEAIMFLHLPQRKLLEDALGQLGQITLVKLDFCQRSSKLDRYLEGELPNIFNPAMETGALMDLGVYCVYPALALFGEPESFTVEPQMMESGADGAGIAYHALSRQAGDADLLQAGAGRRQQRFSGNGRHPLRGVYFQDGRTFPVAQGRHHGDSSTATMKSTS